MAASESDVTLIFTSVQDEVDYNSRLYKEILNPFKEFVDAVQLKDCSHINRILSTEDMEKVESKFRMEGNSAASGLLLECMKRRDKWFSAFMAALKDERLKMTDHIPRFQKIKAIVDARWREEMMKKKQAHARMPTVPKNPAPSSSGIAADSENNNVVSIPQSDFQLSYIANPEDQSEGMQHDMVDDENTEVKRTLSSSSQGDQVDGARPTFTLGDEVQQPDTKGDDMSPSYVDARSGIHVYSRLQSTISRDESTYTSLAKPMQRLSVGGSNSLEVDAQIEMTQEQEMSMASPHIVTAQQESTGDDQQQAARSQQTAPERRKFTSRKEHPSLSVAITDSPQKDFTDVFVAGELCQLPGWVAYSEETAVMDLLKPRLHEDGHYVIWYWMLAKRPTICVTHKRKLLTFVVHKSSSQDLYSCMFYINKRQKKIRSLRDLIKYHLEFGVLHTKGEGPAENILLKTPVT